jgi:hypothetical protein
MRRAAWFALVALVLVVLGAACDAAPGDAGSQAPYHATAAASDVTSDASGEALAAAYREHAPTAAEQKLVAGFWLVLATAQRDGVVDPAILSSSMLDDMAALALEYPSLFQPSSVGSSSQNLVSSPSGFSCDGPCTPADDPLAAYASSLGASLTNAFKNILMDGALPNALANGVINTKRFTDAADKVLSDADTANLLNAASQALNAVGAVTAAAALLAPVGAPLAAVAAVLAGSAALVGMESSWARLQAARDLVAQCNAWKVQNGCPQKGCDQITCPAGSSCTECGGVTGCLPDGHFCCGAELPGAYCPTGQYCLPCGSGLCVDTPGTYDCCYDGSGACPPGSHCIGGGQCQMN